MDGTAILPVDIPVFIGKYGIFQYGKIPIGISQLIFVLCFAKNL